MESRNLEEIVAEDSGIRPFVLRQCGGHNLVSLLRDLPACPKSPQLWKFCIAVSCIISQQPFVEFADGIATGPRCIA
jgi:hypothetical protein